MIETTWFEMTEEMTPFVDGISSPIMRNLKTGEKVPINDLPIGALYASKNKHEAWSGADGLRVYCVLPDRSTWCIDGRANNCDMPKDNEHRCWIRHGTVGDKLTVDKKGKTCGAGGGSIATSKYHGFLRDGVLSNA